LTNTPTKFSEAINFAIKDEMREDNNVICYGLGVTDPKAVFGTTFDLEQEFGSDRVFDVPCSENALTGIGVGASLAGVKPVMVHQRLDFFLLAMDQLVNSAAKWHYMFGSQNSVPITIRLILGRGWGQGPTHSQNLQSWFAHIPGLKVVSPSNASDAYHMLRDAIKDPNPVIYLEHRWLHNSISEQIQAKPDKNLSSAKVVREGNDISVVAASYMVQEAQRAADFLETKIGISTEVIDLRSIRPIDWTTIFSSLKKTRRLLSVDSASKSFSISSEIIATSVENIGLANLKYLGRLGLPDMPEPTSYGLTKNFYNSASDIAQEICKVFGKRYQGSPFINDKHHDVPGDWFKGPF